MTADPPGTRRVLVSEGLFEALGADRVEWGEPDERGFYTPTLTRRADDSLRPEEQHAIDAILDRPHADPDDDAAIVARAAVRLAALAQPSQTFHHGPHDGCDMMVPHYHLVTPAPRGRGHLVVGSGTSRRPTGGPTP